jgi:hypothetical protein
MHRRWVRYAAAGGVLALIVALEARSLARRQTADPSYVPAVAQPAWVDRHPRVLVDAAHHNVHTARGLYKPFADLLRLDGYEIAESQQRLSAERLAGQDLLVVANAMGLKGIVAQFTQHSPLARVIRPAPDAFDDEEGAVVEAWVRAGGALLLVADHRPAGRAASSLARRFGVDMSDAYTEDRQNADPVTGAWTFIVFSREKGLIADHPITNGAAPGERIARVISFTGQSLAGPAGSVAFLPLSETAEDYPTPDSPASDGRPAKGRAQGLALRHGRGRVVVLGEAAMLTAQVTRGPARRIGLSYPGVDNQQLALNIARWLTGRLEPDARP